MPMEIDMLKLPKCINIRGRDYSIKYVEQPLDHNGIFGEGTCDCETKEIELKKDLDPLTCAEYFFHEYFHGLWTELGLADDPMPRILEHVICNGLSKDIINNRKLIIKLLSQLPD